MNHSGTKALESRRCYMRKLEISDSKQLFENVYSDKKVSGYMSWDTYSDEAQVVDYLRKWQEYYDQNECYWGVFLKRSIFKTAETLENRGFLPFSYAHLRLFVA